MQTCSVVVLVEVLPCQGLGFTQNPSTMLTQSYCRSSISLREGIPPCLPIRPDGARPARAAACFLSNLSHAQYSCPRLTLHRIGTSCYTSHMFGSPNPSLSQDPRSVGLRNERHCTLLLKHHDVVPSDQCTNHSANTSARYAPAPMFWSFHFKLLSCPLAFSTHHKNQ